MSPLIAAPPSNPAQPTKPQPVVAHWRTEPRSANNRSDNLWANVGTTDANVLIIDSLPLDDLHLLPAAIATFLLRQARQGYCPPLPALRRLGLRTRREIDEECAALGQ